MNKVPKDNFVLDEIKYVSRNDIRGLQLPKRILFENWDVGKKYSKSIFIYNPSAKIQRFLYEVPKSTAFVMELPKPVKLHTETGVKLNVQFHPKEKRDYNDKLFIKTADNEKIVIKLQAVTSIAFLSGPEEIFFGMCGVSQTVEKTFSIKNNSRRDLDIVWHVNQPFSVEPTSTTIAVDKKFTIKAIFRPRKAAAYTCKAVCTPKNMKNIKHLYYTINFTAQGVYPYLSLVHEKSMDCPNEYEVDFGVVNVNTTSKKEIILVNPLPIKTAFTLTRSEHFLTSNFPFSFEELGGEIAPSGKCPLKALFSPVMPNTEVKDVWNINVNGGFSTKIILLSGKSSGPVVTLSSNIVNFDETERGNIVEKAIKLTNNSTVNTIFQFEIDSKESVFSLEPCIGQITKHSAAVVRIQFKPTYPITYYRRIACIVYMQNPIYLDLLGTAVSSEVQPERLQNWHLETFWDQIRKGQFFFKDENCVLPIVPPKPHPTSVDEYLYDGYHSDFVIIPPPVSLDQNVIDFGRCCHNAYVPTKVFSLTNHTYFVLTITWNGSPANVFSIKPTIVDVQPHRTAVFHLTFKPPGMNQIYSAELEGFAHCTGTGTSALNPGDFNWAPWCLTLTAMGHTYLSARGIYKANYEISSYRVQLPPVPIKSHAARTVLITNKTPTTKIVFNLTSENQDLVVKPRTGVLLKPFAILTIGLTPRLPGPYTTCLHLETNFDKNSIQEIGIEGIASQLLLGLDYSYGLYFKPTCVGVKTERIVVIHNNSPITVNYHWTVKSLYEDVLTVEPLEGVISPHGIQRTRFYFSPQKRIRYTLSVPLTATSEGTFGMIVQKQQEMTVIGEGFSASLKAEPKNLDIGALIVGTLKTEKLMLKNTSYCGLHFKLSIEESGTKLTCKADEGTGRPLCLFLGDKRNDVCAHLPARCDRVIDFKVMPHQHGDYTYKIYYQKLASVDDEESYLSETILLCNIYMNGTHPILQVVEARFLGSATCVRRDRAWELLSLEKLNEYLASEPNYDNKIGQLDESLFPLIDSMQPLNKTVKNIDFHIPPASVGSPPCTLILFLKNPGHVECHWNIWYPWEQKVDVEIWAHTGLYLKTEIDEGRMKDDKLIQIFPKKGRLLPGESQFLTFVYTHLYPSHNILPVRFCLHSGVDIMVTIIAETFEKNISQVYFPFSVHKFTPISYGFNEGTVVSYNIPNHSDAAVKLRLDVLPLRRFQKIHYSHPVIDCLTRRLIIQPGEYLSVLWQIWPLEARTYQVDIPIKFDSDSQVRTLTLLAPTSVTPEPIPNTEKPSMVLTAQPAVLSHDRISFGHVPVCGKLHRMLFITNNSPLPIKFEWYMPYKLLRQRIIFEPKMGLVAPNKSCICQVTLMTGHTPAIYDIYCHAEVMSIKSSQAIQKPRQARNSIQAVNVDNMSYNESMDTFNVHLELKAETHMLDDFWLYFPEQTDSFFIQRPRVRPQKDERLSAKKGQMEMEQETMEVLFETMTTILYNALSDADFTKMVLSACEDPIPYYSQIVNNKDGVRSETMTSRASLMSADSFETSYWTHAKILSRQKSTIQTPKVKSLMTDIFNETYVPAEMKTFPEAMIAVHSVLEAMIWTILDEAYKKEFVIYSRPRVLSSPLS